MRVKAPFFAQHTFRNAIICFLIFVSLTIIEEVNFGTGFVAFMNYYEKEVIIPIQTKRDVRTPISIVVVVQNTSNKEQYSEAQDSVECYAIHHHYPLHLIIVEENDTLSRVCPQNDFMFQRHCVVAHMIFSWPEEWFLFLDADMAVINPNHLIEEYIPNNPEIHVVFYNRIFNHEVMAGSYFIRKSNYSRNFLIHWSNYEFRLPLSFHGSDNGALHSAIVSYELPLQEITRKRCEDLWATSRDYDSLSMYEVCMQLIIASNSLKHIAILQKGLSWARDGWLTNSVWCEKDFILHGWQKRRKDKMRFARWHSPIVDGYWDKTLCRTPSSHLNWRYKDSFIASRKAIQMRLDEIIRNVHGNFEDIQVVLEGTNGSKS